MLQYLSREAGIEELNEACIVTYRKLSNNILSEYRGIMEQEFVPS